jgi:hypothetical protein
LSYHTRGGSGYNTKNKRSTSGFSGKGKKKDNDYMAKYLKGEISEATWRKHLNAERKSSAPSLESVMSNIATKANSEKGSQDFQGWTNWDTWELMLLLENSQPSSNWIDAWGENFAKKIQRGVFNLAEAEKVVAKYLIPIARGTRKPPFYDKYHEFTPDENIDPKKVNKAEVVHNILERYVENHP